MRSKCYYPNNCKNEDSVHYSRISSFGLIKKHPFRKGWLQFIYNMELIVNKNKTKYMVMTRNAIVKGKSQY